MGLFFNIYLCIRFYIDFCIDYLFSLYYNSNRVYIPNASNEIVLESATSLAKKIRERTLKSEYVVTAFIDRIKEVNDIINAVVDNRFEDAILEARQIDEDIQCGKITDVDFSKRPFLGVPFTTKESTACKGLRFTFGLICRKNIRAEDDAKIVELMKKAGGVLLGVTNVPPINLWCETYNPVYGLTSNPYNSTRNVGGSSGGEASIIAAGGSPLGLGTDIGGSIRIPAFRCGLFGHKSSPDLISIYGLTYRTGSEKPTMVVAGPMAKYSEDLIPLLKVMVEANISKLRLDQPVDLRKINVFYMTNMKCVVTSPIGKDMRNALSNVVRYFAETLDNKPKQVYFKDARHSMKFWSYMMKQEKTDFTSDITNRQEKAKLSVEIIKYICGVSEYNLTTIINLINANLPRRGQGLIKKKLDKLRQEILDTLGDDGILLFPSEPFPASYHYTSILRPYNFSYYALWNALNMTVTQVPLGLNSEGMPVGIQVVAAPYQDHLTLAVAKELEKGFGGYVPPFKIDKTLSTD